MARLAEQVDGTLKLASEEAIRFGHRCWGSEHIMLGLTLANGEGEGRAAEILDQLRITEGHIRGLIERYRPSDAEREGGAEREPAAAPVQRVFAAPEVGYIISNTRWVAAYLGSSLAGTEHLLLGTLWFEKSESKVLRDLAVTFEDAYRKTTGQEPPDEIRPLRPVYVSPFGDINALVRALNEILPAGSSLRFAFDDERAWFSTSPETIELQDYIPQALALARKYAQ